MHNNEIKENQDNKSIENNLKLQKFTEDAIIKSHIKKLDDPLKHKHQIDMTINEINKPNSWKNPIDTTKQTDSTINKSKEISKDRMKSKDLKDDKIISYQKLSHKKSKIIASNFINST